MIEFFLKGGIFMIPIVCCSVVSLSIFLEKLWALRRNRIIPQRFVTTIEHLLRSEKIPEARRLCEETEAPISRILLHGIKNFGKPRVVIKEIVEEVGRREAARLDSCIETLGTIASISTLLGLLGTIAGMIRIFGVISAQVTVDPSLLAGGISEALYTTSAGLSVAIPTLIFYRCISTKSDALILAMEEYCLRMVELIKEKQ